MKLTRRQFSLGFLLGALAFIVGRIFGVRREREGPEVNEGAEAWHWSPGDHLAG